MEIKGKAWKFEANVDTDAILPACYLNRTDPQELAAHCFEVTNPEFCAGAGQGDIIVADENFGCGSSREHAPVAIKAKGVSCVIAASFARIFFRNGFNVGLPLLESREAAEKIEEGQLISVDLGKGVIYNETTGESYLFEPIPDNMKQMLADGGLMEHLSKQAGH